MHTGTNHVPMLAHYICRPHYKNDRILRRERVQEEKKRAGNKNQERGERGRKEYYANKRDNNVGSYHDKYDNKINGNNNSKNNRKRMRR